MEVIKENELDFMKKFSESLDLDSLEYISCREKSDFLNNDIAKKYLAYFLKGIDSRLYLTFMNMLKSGNICFLKSLNIERAHAHSYIDVSNNSVISSGVNLPYVNNGYALMVCGHELGHGLRANNRSGNTRLELDKVMFNEAISILLGYLCMETYIEDFGINDQVKKFELLNINNAILCKNSIKSIIKEYEEELTRFDKFIKQNKSEISGYNYMTARNNINKLVMEMYKKISYPIGIALINLYIEMDSEEKKQYLRLISSYIMSKTNISIMDIINYYIPSYSLDGHFYDKNFNEYINNSIRRLQLLGGEKQ